VPLLFDAGKRRRFVRELASPPLVRSILTDVKWGWVLLPVRLYAGWLWLQAGWGKVGSASWTGARAGSALVGFANAAILKAAGAHPAVQGWYASFLHAVVLPHATAWSQMVAWGELLVGLGLIAGAFTGVAAFFGGFMNLNYLLAGSTSTNPILLMMGVCLVLAWRTAGAWGLDGWLLPALGTPWTRGLAFAAPGPLMAGRVQPLRSSVDGS
jgi:thiosulfate dehydrogenase (quinone) large subunit